MLVEGIITLIIVAALFYVAPGVLYSVKVAAPFVASNYSATNSTGVVAGGVANPLNASQGSIATTAVGALNLSSIGLIMLGIGLMIGGFMLVRGYK
jgi:hypothetical protein